MRKFSFGKLLFGMSLSLSSFTLSSCSSFFATSQGYLIEDMTYTTDENGNTRITVTFDDKTVTPLEITIPRGVGIDHIDSSVNGDNTSVTLTIYYTDENLDPATLTLPIVKGDDGRGVENISCTQNESGDYNLVFEMSDGSQIGPFTIKKGEDGRDIVDITAATNEETGYTTISVEFNDGTTEKFDVQLGKDGRGIEYIETLPDIGNNYVIRVHYSDGTSEEVQFAKPSTNRWFSGATSPAATLGSDGDYYIDTSSKSFYMKTSGSWLLLFSLDESETNKQTFKVTFDKNGGEWDWTSESTPSGDTRQFSYEEGSFIDFDIAELKVVKNGYTFNGWWTDAEINANSGHFTKLTPVTCDIMLYANWIENA